MKTYIYLESPTNVSWLIKSYIALSTASSSDNMPDASLYPVSLHHSASATFVPSAHDMTAAQHYGPSTSSSQPQPGTSGVRGRNLNFVLPLSLSCHIFFLLSHCLKKRSESTVQLCEQSGHRCRCVHLKCC